MEYVLIFLAVLCFVGQFAFTKIYEGTVKQTAASSLIMLTVTVLLTFFIVFRVSQYF